MSDLTLLEKKHLEAVLGMETGYVLNFTDRSFAEFVLESTKLNIDDDKYRINGHSKAKRLRAFWQRESNATVGKLLSDFLDYREDTGAQAQICRSIVGRLLGGKPPKTTTFQPHSVVDDSHYSRLAASMKDVMALAPQPRGFAFERFLNDAFATFNLDPRRSFRLTGEQIDGSFHLADDTYLVEAKWQAAQIGNHELQAFGGTVRTKSSWTRSLYISYSGFSEDGLYAFGRGDATRIICMDGYELWQIMEHKLNLCEVLSLKARRAAETGRAYFPVRELYPNI